MMKGFFNIFKTRISKIAIPPQRGHFSISYQENSLCSFITLLLIMTASLTVNSQTTNFDCGNEDYETGGAIIEDFNNKSNNNCLSSMTTIPLSVVFFRNDDGLPIPFDVDEEEIPEEFDQVLIDVNSRYAAGNIRFERVGGVTFIRNSDLNNFSYGGSDNDSDQDVLSFYQNPNAVNVYLMFSHPNSGKSNFAGNCGSEPFVFFKRRSTFGNNLFTKHTFNHELGHMLGLFHTFRLYSNEDHYEKVTQQNCGQPDIGDELCDTPADINPQREGGYDSNNCSFLTPHYGFEGSQYMPDFTNYMSYYSQCTNSFTTEQFSRMEDQYCNCRQNQIDLNNVTTINDFVLYKGGGNGVEGVFVDLSETFGGMDIEHSDVSESTGEIDFYLQANSYYADNYILGSEPNGDYNYGDWTDGVTTFDRVKIAKHYQNQELLYDHDLISADVDRNGVIQQKDDTDLRDLIIGVDTELANWDAPWQFVPEQVANNANFNSNALSSTLSYPTYLTDSYLINRVSNQNGFDLVKIGDINDNNSNASLKGEEDAVKANHKVSLVTLPFSKQLIRTGDILNISFSAKNFSDVVTYQFGLDFPFDAFEVLELNKGALPYFSEDNFNVQNDNLRTVWLDYAAGENAHTDKVKIFILKVRATRDLLDLFNLFTLDENKLPAKFYTESGSTKPVTLELDIQLENGTNVVEEDNQIVVYPNPFTTSTNISYPATTVTEAEIMVQDKYGNIIYSTQQQTQKGINNFELTANALADDKLYFIIVRIGDKTYSKKVVALK